MTRATQLTEELRGGEAAYFRGLRHALNAAGFDVDRTALVEAFSDGFEEATKTEVDGFIVVTPDGRAHQGLYMRSQRPDETVASARVQFNPSLLSMRTEIVAAFVAAGLAALASDVASHHVADRGMDTVQD